MSGELQFPKFPAFKSPEELEQLDKSLAGLRMSVPNRNNSEIMAVWRKAHRIVEGEVITHESPREIEQGGEV